jgi:hypothetical protein
MRNDLQLALEGGQQRLAILRLELGWQVQAEFPPDRLHHHGVAAAQEVAFDVRQIDGQPKPRKFGHEHPRADDLAVDQHAVAVEDDKVELAHAPMRSATVELKVAL